MCLSYILTTYPRTGDLRFRLPVANDPYTGVHNATSFGPVCPQQSEQYVILDNLAPEAKAFLSAPSTPLTDSEDCKLI
jgi:acetylcholinesterase